MTTGKNKNLQGKNITLILFQILMFYFLIQSVFNEQSYIYIAIFIKIWENYGDNLVFNNIITTINFIYSFCYTLYYYFYSKT